MASKRMKTVSFEKIQISARVHSTITDHSKMPESLPPTVISLVSLLKNCAFVTWLEWPAYTRFSQIDVLMHGYAKRFTLPKSSTQANRFLLLDKQEALMSVPSGCWRTSGCRTSTEFQMPTVLALSVQLLVANSKLRISWIFVICLHVAACQ